MRSLARFGAVRRNLNEFYGFDAVWLKIVKSNQNGPIGTATAPLYHQPRAKQNQAASQTKSTNYRRNHLRQEEGKAAWKGTRSKSLQPNANRLATTINA